MYKEIISYLQVNTFKYIDIFFRPNHGHRHTKRLKLSMYLTHDQGQEKIVDFLLQNWRSGKNLNHYISQNIERITPPADWPAPDAYFQGPDKKSYKPSRETKRGMLTGLGQAISYIDILQVNESSPID